MPVCCRCNASGRCKNCSCKKSSKPCEDCLPSHQGRCENGRSLPDAVELTDQESPSTAMRATTYSSSFLSHKEESEQGSELPNTFCFDDNPHTLPSYPQIHEPSFTWGMLTGLLSHVTIIKLSIGNVICSRFLLVKLETRLSRN